MTGYITISDETTGRTIISRERFESDKDLKKILFAIKGLGYMVTVRLDDRIERIEHELKNAENDY